MPKETCTKRIEEVKTQLEVGDCVYEICNGKIDDIFTITRVTKARAIDETHKYCSVSFWRALDRRGELKRVGFAGSSYYQYYLEDSKLRTRYRLQKRRDIIQKQLLQLSCQLSRLNTSQLIGLELIIDEFRELGLEIIE